MTPELRSAIRTLVESYKFRCVNVYEDEDSYYRRMPKHAQELFRALTGREVMLDEFFVATGGYCDGEAVMTTKLVDEIMKRLNDA